MYSILAATILTAILGTSRIEFVAVTPETIDGLPMSNAQCLAVNPRNEEFLVADALNDRILVFDTTGLPVFDFPLGDNRHNPFGIAVDTSDEIIVGAMDSPVLWVYDYSGNFIDNIDLPDSVFPGRLLALPGGDLLVINRAGRGALRIDHSGNIVSKYDVSQEECRPSGISLDEKGNIVLVSSAGPVLTAFDHNGKALFSFGEHGREQKDFSHPTTAAIDNNGNFWIVDSFRHELKLYDSDHNFKDVFGQRGTNKGEFYFPADIKITSRGKMGILDKGSGRLQIFRLNYDK
jgi:DNA-binding beta-propeller fold protein YncE